MVELPLNLRLKKKKHKTIARAQDRIIKVVYSIFDKAVLHGGTAIWRCYKGNRFSEDIDILIPRDVEKINKIFEKLGERGFEIEKKKIGENSLYSTLVLNGEKIRLEAIFKEVSGVLEDYETAGGEFISIYSMTPERLIKEKAKAYLKRRKIRDLYDVFFLLKHVENINEIKKDLNNLLKSMKEPVDKKDLQVIVFEGVIPSVEEMLNYIKRKIKQA